MLHKTFRVVVMWVVVAAGAPVGSRTIAADWQLAGNPDLTRYFEQQVGRIEQEQTLLRYENLQQWQQQKDQLRSELFDMLGLQPRPEKTPLNVRITGMIQHDEFRVEKLTFESMPGLYVTANLYVPNEIEERLPTILYVCGHARMKSPDGEVSYGNKTGYQHHGAWFARNGYVCLTIDTLQLGEIEGIHHGTYRHDRWWWNSYGYTPAGVEAWNCIRALDYLESRDEVDSSRFGVTGRSGGGAYSWWISALDERIKCAVPVAGITTLRNHVVDGCVEGHCDCMFMVNTQRWDYSKVAALVAPRPLLISNSDKDRIFPLEGVVEIHRQVRHIYNLYGEGDQLGLQITEGPHKDTQELRIHAFRWFNRWLKNEDELIAMPAEKLFSPPQLRVFEELPSDEQNTSIDQDFVSVAAPWDKTRLQQAAQNDAWLDRTVQQLRRVSLRAWPQEQQLQQIHVSSQQNRSLSQRLADAGYRAVRIHFSGQQHVPLFVDVYRHSKSKAPTELVVLEDGQWDEWASVSDSGTPGGRPSHPRLAQLVENQKSFAVFAPRGAGPHRWEGDERKQIQIRRRFQLIGTTVDAMRIWDIRAAAAVLDESAGSGLVISGVGRAGWLALLAVGLGSGEQAIVDGLTTETDQIPVLLNFRRHFTPVQLFAAIVAGKPVTVRNAADELQQAAQWVSH